MFKAGDVFKKNQTIHVVTNVNDGEILDSIPLEQYVNWNVLVTYEGKEMYIHEVIAQRCNDYLKDREIKILQFK